MKAGRGVWHGHHVARGDDDGDGKGNVNVNGKGNGELKDLMVKPLAEVRPRTG